MTSAADIVEEHRDDLESLAQKDRPASEIARILLADEGGPSG